MSNMKGTLFQPTVAALTALCFLGRDASAAETIQSLEAKLGDLGDLGFPLPTGGAAEASTPFKLGLKALLLDMNGLAREQFQTAGNAGFAFAHWGSAIARHSTVTYENDDLEVANRFLNRTLEGESQLNPFQKKLVQAAVALFMPGKSRVSRVETFTALLKEIVDSPNVTNSFVKLLYIKSLLETAQLSRNETLQNMVKDMLRPTLDTADIVDPDLRLYYYYLALITYKRIDEAETAKEFANAFNSSTNLPAYSFHLARAGIYVRLGLWKMAHSAISAANSLVEDRTMFMQDSGGNYPRLNWLRVKETKHFIHLQRGEFVKGLEVLNEVREFVGRIGNGSDPVKQAFLYRMTSRHYFETYQLNLPSPSLPDVQQLDERLPNGFYTTYSEAALHVATAHKLLKESTYDTNEIKRISVRVDQIRSRTLLHVNGSESLAALHSLHLVDYCKYQLMALWAYANKSLPQAKRYLTLAARIEEVHLRTAFSMEPTILFLPSMELYGDMMQQMYSEEQGSSKNTFKGPALHIQAYYQLALVLYPNRPSTVYRIAKIFGDADMAVYYIPVAVKWYTKTKDNWVDADTTFDGLREAQIYIESKNPPDRLNLVIGLGAGAVGLVIIVVVIVACCRRDKEDFNYNNKGIEAVNRRNNKDAKRVAKDDVATTSRIYDTPEIYDARHFESANSDGTASRKPEYKNLSEPVQSQRPQYDDTAAAVPTVIVTDEDVGAGVSEMTVSQTYFDDTATDQTMSFERHYNTAGMSTFSDSPRATEGTMTMAAMDKPDPHDSIDDDDGEDDNHHTWDEDSKPLINIVNVDDAADSEREEAPPPVYTPGFHDLDTVIASQEGNTDDMSDDNNRADHYDSQPAERETLVSEGRVNNGDDNNATGFDDLDDVIASQGDDDAAGDNQPAEPETSMTGGTIDHGDDNTYDDRDSNGSSFRNSFPPPPPEIDIEIEDAPVRRYDDDDDDENQWVTSLDDERRY
ncbi:uncharacterized protein LOC106163208 [Lingula anatina]|uniref:Uncharacterized protein LOC106163208 n=1 Tax=Lingula anatina TaxID=7574 RepID=A0A1S3IFE0_LINAN|nr:uncharacterized protein LOC106163208 [Lingula anatina]|eukprot:XP_013396179.1 uncharacterized protein LOC106163208 [Lingula anatina]